MRVCVVSALAGLLLASIAQPQQSFGSGVAVAAALRDISIDPTQTYQVRNLQLSRGDIKLYLTEGTLAFATPCLGKHIAAVFTTAYAEAGDAEVLVLPPQRSERASLAAFTKTPNLDEHFSSAIFLFSDDTAEEALAQIKENPIHSPAAESSKLAAAANAVLRQDSFDIDVSLTRALLDNHPASHGFFYAMITGRSLGTFDVVYQPDDFEPIRLGRVVPAADAADNFQVWTSFRPRHAATFTSDGGRIADYRLNSEIHSDLSMSSVARFQYTAGEDDGRVVSPGLAGRLHITSARIDGRPAEVFQHESARNTDLKGSSTFLVVADSPFAAHSKHEIEVSYEGSVIRRTGNGAYFVDERNTWYPFINPMLTKFDLSFQCPAKLRLVATGEPIEEEVRNGVRSVHRKTLVRESLAGFNLGEYDAAGKDRDGYHVEIFSEKNHSAAAVADLPERTAEILGLLFPNAGVRCLFIHWRLPD